MNITLLMLFLSMLAAPDLRAQLAPVPSPEELKAWSPDLGQIKRTVGKTDKGGIVLNYFNPLNKETVVFSTSGDKSTRIVRVLDAQNRPIYENIFKGDTHTINEYKDGRLKLQEKITSMMQGNFDYKRQTLGPQGELLKSESFLAEASIFQDSADVQYMGCTYAIGYTPSAELDRLLANGGRVINFTRADDTAEGISLGSNTTVRNCEGYAGREGRNGNLVAARDLRDAMNQGIRCLRDISQRYSGNPLAAHMGRLAQIMPGLFDPSRAHGAFTIACGERARPDVDPFRRTREFVAERKKGANIGIVAEAVTCKRWGDFDNLSPPAIAINLDKVPAPDTDANIKERKSTFFHESLHLLGITHADKLAGPCAKNGECMDLPYYAEMCCFDQNEAACERMTQYRHGHIFKAGSN